MFRVIPNPNPNRFERRGSLARDEHADSWVGGV